MDIDKPKIDVKLDLSIIIPVFNEASTLEELHRRLVTVLDQLDKTYEIIFIDDGSTDDSLQVLKALQQADKRLRIISFMRNFGQHPAIIAGFTHCRSEVAISMDADLQNPPEEIPKILAKIDQGYEHVGGWRQGRSDSFFRRLTSKLANRMIARFTGVELNDYGCALRAYTRNVIESLVGLKERTIHISAMACWMGFNSTEVPIEHEVRKVGKSSYNLRKLLRMVFDLVTGYSSFPMELMSFIGFIFAFLGFLLGGYLLMLRLIYGVVSGFRTVVALGFIFMGIQLLSLGIIGQYLVRNYNQTQDRPLYIIREIIDD